MLAIRPAEELIPTIAYIRVSMAREEMISPELQRSAIEAWAHRTGHRIIEWVEDLDKTGRNFKRKIMRVIERIEAGEAQAIAVWKYSRFGRSRTGVPANLARVEKAGGQLLSATEEIDAGTATGRFQRGMIMELNAFESDRAGEQWTETHQWRRDQGLPATGGRRFGYIWHPRKLYAPDGTITLQEERYVPNPETENVVIELFRRYVAGEGFIALASHLNAAGIRNAHNDLWYDRSLCMYMDSGFAAGFLRVHDENCKIEPYLSRCPNHVLYRHPTRGHTPIIGMDLWQEYQERRSFTRTAAPRSRAAAYILSGLGRCKHCSGAARRVVRHGHAYFFCDQRSRKGTSFCSGFTGAPVPAAEKAVLAWLQEIANDVDGASATAATPRAIPAPAASFEQQRAAAERDVARIERAVAKHMRAYALVDDEDAEGTLEREYLATLAELKAEKRAAAEALAALSMPSPSESAEMGRAAARPIVIGLLEEWGTIAPGITNAALRRVIRRVEIAGGGEFRVVPAWETP